jgi:mannose-6-phosphate isomerase-like protein (cupin superfamily)
MDTTMTGALRRYDASQGPRKMGRTEGKTAELGGCGVRFMVYGEESGGGFSLVEHPIPPKTLAAPIHRHTREDEYSYVLEGRMGALLGDDVVYAEPGELAFKPGDQWHTFWNAGDTPCRILEIISPAGFEHYFEEIAAAMQAPDFDPEKLGEIGARYGLEAQADSVARVCAEHGLDHPLLHMG